MKNKLCIYICNSLVPEVAHLLQTGDYPDVELKGFNAACTAKTFNEEDILKIIGNHISEFDKIIVIVSNCFRKATPGIQCPKNVEIIQFEQCLELLFNLPC